MEKLNICLAIICIAGLAAYAVSQGINGAVLSTAFTFIGGLGGFIIAKKISKPKA